LTVGALFERRRDKTTWRRDEEARWTNELSQPGGGALGSVSGDGIRRTRTSSARFNTTVNAFTTKLIMPHHPWINVRPVQRRHNCVPWLRQRVRLMWYSRRATSSPTLRLTVTWRVGRLPQTSQDSVVGRAACIIASVIVTSIGVGLRVDPV